MRKIFHCLFLLLIGSIASNLTAQDCGKVRIGEWSGYTITGATAFNSQLNNLVNYGPSGYYNKINGFKHTDITNLLDTLTADELKSRFDIINTGYSNMSPTNAQKIKQYVDKGGVALIFLDAGSSVGSSLHQAFGGSGTVGNGNAQPTSAVSTNNAINNGIWGDARNVSLVGWASSALVSVSQLPAGAIQLANSGSEARVWVTGAGNRAIFTWDEGVFNPNNSNVSGTDINTNQERFLHNIMVYALNQVNLTPLFVTPATPSVTTVAATYASNGTASITNYNSSYTYKFTPSGPTVSTNGSILNLSPGVSYTVIASSTCDSPPVTLKVDPQIIIDSDGDGIPDDTDLDDDNDGIPDTIECPSSSNGLLTYYNSGTYGSSITASTLFSLAGNSTSGSGLTRQLISPYSYMELTGIDGTTESQAITNNEYVEYSFTTKDNVSAFINKIGYYNNTPATSGSSSVVNVQYNFSVKISDDNFLSSAALLSNTTNGTGDGSITTPVIADYRLVPNKAYKIRVYFYAVAGGASKKIAHDDFTILGYIECDTDGDGIPNRLDLDSDGDGCPDAIEGGGTFTNADLINSSMPGGNSGSSYTGTSASPVIKNLGNTVGNTSTTMGIPTIAGTGQTIGDSQNGAVSQCDSYCYKPGDFTSGGGISRMGITSLSKQVGWPENIPNGQIALESKTKGMVISRVLNSSIINDPKEGMLVYDIQAKCVKLYNGTVWNCIKSACTTPTPRKIRIGRYSSYTIGDTNFSAFNSQLNNTANYGLTGTFKGITGFEFSDITSTLAGSTGTQLKASYDIINTGFNTMSTAQAKNVTDFVKAGGVAIINLDAQTSYNFSVIINAFGITGNNGSGEINAKSSPVQQMSNVFGDTRNIALSGTGSFGRVLASQLPNSSVIYASETASGGGVAVWTVGGEYAGRVIFVWDEGLFRNSTVAGTVIDTAQEKFVHNIMAYALEKLGFQSE